MLDKYGKHDLGRQCLLARRLLENDITFVQVSHSNYDTHNENFNFHLEQLGEFDQSFSALIDDLAQRGVRGDPHHSGVGHPRHLDDRRSDVRAAARRGSQETGGEQQNKQCELPLHVMSPYYRIS